MTGRRSHGRLSALNGVVHQGNLAVEQRSDEFAAKLLGLDDPPALPVGARPPALDPAAASVRLLGHLSSNTLERAHAELTRPPDQRRAESDPA